MTDHVEALRSCGYTVVDGVMTPAEVDVARRALDEIFAREAPIAERRRWRNSAHIVSYMLPAKHPSSVRSPRTRRCWRSRARCSASAAPSQV